MKYCIPTPIRLETIQYIDSPAGNCNEKNPSIIGIIHSIMAWLDCCLGSAEGVVVIFCCKNVVAATRNGIMMGDGSGAPKSSQRNCALIGTAWCTGINVIHEYTLSEYPIKSSGVVYRIWIKTLKSPMRIGIWMINGPKQPTGLTPASLYTFIVS